MVKILSVVIVVSILFSSCKEIFEEDLSESVQTLLAPSDNTIQTNTNATFMWSEVEGATEYQLQVVSPNFTSPQVFHVDSMVTDEELTIELSPDEFEWRVRAVNYASFTDYSAAWTLTIDSSYDLTSQSLILYTPEDLEYSNDTAITFTWQELYAAENYNFILVDGAVWSSGTELENANPTDDSYTSTYSFLEGTYSWSVRGENSLPSNTSYATERVLYVDQTLPATPIGLLPDDLTSNLLADSVYLFDWTRPVDPGTVNSPLFDTVYVYSDTNQLPINTLYSGSEDIDVTLPSSAGTYYWKVTTFDKAGNESETSNINSFIVL